MYCSIPAYASPIIVVLGDSLSAAYKLQPKQGWVSLLSDKIIEQQLNYQVINSSGVGDTTADGLRKLPNLIADKQPQILILALGSNDGLRGTPIPMMQTNLRKIIEQAQNKNVKVLLIGFKLPPNYGTQYREAFEKVYVDLSTKYDLPFVPFLLNGFAMDLNYFLADTLHPTAAAQPLIVNNVWPHLEPMLDLLRSD